jgi:hypothetical protein
MVRTYRYYDTISYQGENNSANKLKMKEKNEELIVEQKNNMSYISSTYHKLIVDNLLK